jgi:hypothetical protein
VFGTRDSPHFIIEENGNVPKGDKLETAKGLSRVVGRTGTMTFRTKGFAVLARMKDGDDVLFWSAFLFKGNFSKTEGLVIRDGIDYSFQKHLGRGRRMEGVRAVILLSF